MTVFPDASIVQMHRDPEQVMASYCSLIATSHRSVSRRVDLHEIGQNALNRWSIGLAQQRFLCHFKIPTLWGTPNTAPYFHDNSAKNLDDVLDQYNFMFGALRDFAVAAGCNPVAPECLSEQDKTDIKAFLQLLAFDQ